MKRACKNNYAWRSQYESMRNAKREIYRVLIDKGIDVEMVFIS